jgi:hypothetical protein
MKYRIESDEDPMNPRKEFDNLGVMCCLHRRYDLGDEHDIKADDFICWQGIEDHLRKELGAVVVLPLYLLDHSGITMSTDSSGFRACDPAGWDCGQVGFIYATREAVLANFMKKRLTKSLLEQAAAVLVSEVEVYDQYLRGDVWGFILEDDQGNVVDSLWGMFGYDYAKQEAEEALTAMKGAA